MIYTTHGLMTPADLAEHRADHDLDAWKDELTPEQRDNLTDYGDPCGDVDGIDGPAVTCQRGIGCHLQ